MEKTYKARLEVVVGNDAKMDMSIIKDWIHLSDEEALAIRWHMGAYTGESSWNTLSKVYDRCPEALCVHMADMIATHVLEVES